jgi:glycosyltransferase involved in cell wall biosynthesis
MQERTIQKAADLYTHPARADNCPTTVLEALARGTPVVASAVGGIPEQVVEGRTGFLVPVGDARALAGRVLALLAGEELWVRMGRQAAGDVARFGGKRMVGEYLAFYDEILNDK